MFTFQVMFIVRVILITNDIFEAVFYEPHVVKELEAYHDKVLGRYITSVGGVIRFIWLILLKTN